MRRFGRGEPGAGSRSVACLYGQLLAVVGGEDHMRWITAVVLVTLTANVAAAATSADKLKSSIASKMTLPSGTVGSTGQFKALCVCNATDEVGVVESFNGTP